MLADGALLVWEEAKLKVTHAAQIRLLLALRYSAWLRVDVHRMNSTLTPPGSADSTQFSISTSDGTADWLINSLSVINDANDPNDRLFTATRIELNIRR